MHCITNMFQTAQQGVQIDVIPETKFKQYHFYLRDEARCNTRLIFLCVHILQLQLNHLQDVYSG